MYIQNGSFSFSEITHNRFPNYTNASFKREVNEICQNARTLLKRRKDCSKSLKKGKTDMQECKCCCTLHFFKLGSWNIYNAFLPDGVKS